jgi:1-acyl-sn-glycerol-3-phosphate acyltransferase
VTSRSYVFRGEGNGWWQRFSWNLGRSISRLFSMLLFRFHARGQGQLPRSGGVLLVSNHQSFLDPWLMGIAVSRQVHYMARDTLFRGGILLYLLELWNSFPVKRGTADLGAIRTGVERLDKGFMLNIFPEGTRSEDGSIGPMSPGMALILNRCKSEVVVVPVVIEGAFEAWPRGARFPRPWVIRIVYGRSIAPAEWRQWGAQELAMRLRGELVKLQQEIGSVHATRSRQRLAADVKEAGETGTARKRRR